GAQGKAAARGGARTGDRACPCYRLGSYQNFTVRTSRPGRMPPGMSVRATTPAARVRRSAPAVRAGQLRLAAVAAALLALAVLLGLVFSGSPGKLAPGTRIAGVDVGGLSPSEATRTLERRSARLAHVPVTFVAGTHTFRLRPDELSVTPDWARAVEQAQGDGDGMNVIRGFRR